jgi:hypothetical protein
VSDERRDRLIHVLGLLALSALVLDALAPALLLRATLPAGGDTPSHYPTAARLLEALLPQGRLHGWNAGAFLGHPLQLYYFPLPFVLMAALAPAVGLPLAFKLVMAAGALLLPLSASAGLRALGFRFPAPLLGACAATLFLFVDENPIWGGSLASLLAGEFAFAWGLALALLFLGTLYRAYARGEGLARPALLLALTALAHGYALLWAGASAAFFLYASRRPGRTLAWLGGVAGLAFALAGVFLVPLLLEWRWTTPYADAWIDVAARNLAPPLLVPLFALALLGLGLALVDARRAGGADQRLLFLWHAAAAAALLAVVAPAFGVIDVRLVPCAQLALALCGAVTLARLLESGRALPSPAALDTPSGSAREQQAPAPPPDLRGGLAARVVAAGLVLATLAAAEAHSRTVRAWARWDFGGLEEKELWPAFARLGDALRGSPADPRVAVEWHEDFGRGGSVRLPDLLPFIAQRATLDGLYAQAALHSPAVYYLASQLGPRAPNPFRSREYATFDPAAALPRLRLFHVREIVAVSAELRAALGSHPEVERVTTVAPFEVFRLRDTGRGYVEPLAVAPLRAPVDGWRDASYRWLRHEPLPRAHLVFGDEAPFAAAPRDPAGRPPETPLPGADEVRVESRLEEEALHLRTNRPGHPLLVKVSYHPRWRAEGADGPYLASPAMMLIVPRRESVTLRYAARTWADWAGLSLSLTGLGLAAALAWRSRWAAAPAPRPFRPKRVGADGLPLPTRRWGAVVPVAIALLLLAKRFS